MVLMGSARKAHIDLRKIKLQFRTDQEIDAEVHFFQDLSKRVGSSIA